MSRAIWSRWFSPASGARFADRTSARNDDPLSQQLAEIERALRREDPTFLKRLRRLRCNEVVNVLTVFGLLASGAVLVTVGLATASVTVCSIAITAMLTACFIDRRYHQALRRPPRESDAP